MDTQTPAIREGAASLERKNPYVLWRQILGFIFWGGLPAFLAGGPVVAAWSLALGGVTFADAWKSGIYRHPEREDGILKGFLNISPMGWGIAMALLFPVAYPAYLLTRNNLCTIPGTKAYYRATIILGAIVVVGVAIQLVGAVVLDRK